MVSQVRFLPHKGGRSDLWGHLLRIPMKSPEGGRVRQ